MLELKCIPAGASLCNCFIVAHRHEGFEPVLLSYCILYDCIKNPYTFVAYLTMSLLLFMPNIDKISMLFNYFNLYVVSVFFFTTLQDDELDISPVEIDEGLVIEDDEISDDDEDDENDDV